MSEPSKSPWERVYEESIDRAQMSSTVDQTDSLLAFSDHLRALIFVSALGGGVAVLSARLFGVARSGDNVTFWVGCGVTGVGGCIVWWWRVRRRNRAWDDWPPSG